MYTCEAQLYISMVVPLFRLRLIVFPFMVLHSGHFPVLPSITLGLLSTRIWRLPSQSRTGSYSSLRGKSGQSLQPCLPALFFSSALKCPSILVCAIFHHSSCTSYSGYITLCLDCVTKSVMIISVVCVLQLFVHAAPVLI